MAIRFLTLATAQPFTRSAELAEPLALSRGRHGRVLRPFTRLTCTAPNDGAVNVAKIFGWDSTELGIPLPLRSPPGHQVEGVPPVPARTRPAPGSTAQVSTAELGGAPRARAAAGHIHATYECKTMASNGHDDN